VDDGDPYDAYMELEGNGALNTYDDEFIIAYLQACEVLIGLTPQKLDSVVLKAKQFK
jgi:hypothetical protein